MKLDTPFFLTAKYARWIADACILLFILLIAFEMVSWWFSKDKSLMSSPMKPNLEPIIQKDPMIALANSTLFGVYVPEDVNEQNIKKSMLDVTLVGILLSNKKNNSQVIIRSSSGIEKNYKIGDSIPGEAIIKRITADGVLVEHEGHIESIRLPKHDLIFEPVQKPLKEEENP